MGCLRESKNPRLLHRLLTDTRLASSCCANASVEMRGAVDTREETQGHVLQTVVGAPGNAVDIGARQMSNSEEIHTVSGPGSEGLTGQVNKLSVRYSLWHKHGTSRRAATPSSPRASDACSFSKTELSRRWRLLSSVPDNSFSLTAVLCDAWLGGTSAPSARPYPIWTRVASTGTSRMASARARVKKPSTVYRTAAHSRQDKWLHGALQTVLSLLSFLHFLYFISQRPTEA